VERLVRGACVVRALRRGRRIAADVNGPRVADRRTAWLHVLRHRRDTRRDAAIVRWIAHMRNLQAARVRAVRSLLLLQPRAAQSRAREERHGRILRPVWNTAHYDLLRRERRRA
jgi:hypothetical protein